MPSYINAYDIARQVREDINDYSAAKLQGTDTSGAFSNETILRRINQAHRFIYALLINQIPDEFHATVSLTASSSVLTLPWDFGKIEILKDQYGQRCYPITYKDTHLATVNGFKRFYRRAGQTLVIDQDSVSDTYTLGYFKKARDLNFGKAAAGAAGSVTLASSAKKIADYYNGMKIEDNTNDWSDTISDYSTARVATISGTGVANGYYGIVSDMPEPFHHLIGPLAVILLNSISPIALEKQGPQEMQAWYDQLNTAMVGYLEGRDDIDVEELFTDFETGNDIYQLWVS